MTWLKKILGIGRLEAQVESLRELVKCQESELKNYRNYENYVTLPVPSGDAINKYLSDLGYQKMFLFYLMTLENEILVLFRNGKDADVYKGGLRIIDKIRDDMKQAMFAESKKNAQV